MPAKDLQRPSAASFDGRKLPTNHQGTTMNRRHLLSLSMVAALATVLLPSNAFAQQKSLKEQLVGTWALVSAETTNKDGSKVHSFGPNPKGMVIFAADGRYVQVNIAAALPKFASGNRMTGSAEENKAVVQGSIAYYGTWSVDEATKLVSQHVDANTYALHTGTAYKRPISTLTADDLVFTNPGSSAGGGSTVLTFKRVK
jgi:hypothetical protein